MARTELPSSSEPSSASQLIMLLPDDEAAATSTGAHPSAEDSAHQLLDAPRASHTITTSHDGSDGALPRMAHPLVLRSALPFAAGVTTGNSCHRGMTPQQVMELDEREGIRRRWRVPQQHPASSGSPAAAALLAHGAPISAPTLPHPGTAEGSGLPVGGSGRRCSALEPSPPPACTSAALRRRSALEPGSGGAFLGAHMPPSPPLAAGGAGVAADVKRGALLSDGSGGPAAQGAQAAQHHDGLMPHSSSQGGGGATAPQGAHQHAPASPQHHQTHSGGLPRLSTPLGRFAGVSGGRTHSEQLAKLSLLDGAPGALASDAFFAGGGSGRLAGVPGTSGKGSATRLADTVLTDALVAGVRICGRNGCSSYSGAAPGPGPGPSPQPQQRQQSPAPAVVQDRASWAQRFAAFMQ